MLSDHLEFSDWVTAPHLEYDIIRPSKNINPYLGTISQQKNKNNYCQRITRKAYRQHRI